MNENEYRTNAATIRLIAPNIIEMVIHEDTVLDVDNLWEMKRINNLLGNEQAYVLLIDAAAGTTVTKEGRQLVASAEFKQFTKAIALIKRSSLVGTIFNFYVNLNRPKTPIQMFTNRAEAKEWLQQLLAK
jgi:hypothetical protein